MISDKIKGGNLEYNILFVAWVFWGLSMTLMQIENARVPNISQIITISALQTLTCLVMNFILIYIMIRLETVIVIKRSQLVLFAVLVIIFSVIIVSINTTLFFYIKGNQKLLQAPTRYLVNAMEKMIFLTGFCTMFFLIRKVKEIRKQKSMVEEAQQTARDAQLQMLQQQINPHFLFNTLNSLRSLIAIDSDRARNMLTDLSEFLRFTLSSYKSVQNTIEDEIKLLEHYLKIQKVRFQESIEYCINMDTRLRSFTIPKFLLQPIVENAVKFGMKTSPIPLVIDVSIKSADDSIDIVITNTGSLCSPKTDTHNNNGISNIKKRLELMYAERAEFTLKEDKGKVVARISIIHFDL